MTRRASETLEAYLDRVSDAMRRDGRDAAEIDAVREGLREQVWEQAAAEGGSEEAVERAIASLDAPTSYAAPEAPTPERRRASGLAVFSAVSSVGGALLVAAIGFLGDSRYEDPAGGAFVMAELLALASGLIAWREPLGRFGAISAMLLLVLLGLILVIHLAIGA